jgi:hypothetical protein
MKNSVNGYDFIELIGLLSLPRNDDFTQIDDNLQTESSLGNVGMTLVNYRFELNSMEADNELDDDQLEHTKIETFGKFRKS